MDKTIEQILTNIRNDKQFDALGKFEVTEKEALEAMKIFGKQAYHAKAKEMNNKIGWLYIPEVTDREFDEYLKELEEKK